MRCNVWPTCVFVEPKAILCGFILFFRPRCLCRCFYHCRNSSLCPRRLNFEAEAPLACCCVLWCAAVFSTTAEHLPLGKVRWESIVGSTKYSCSEDFRKYFTTALLHSGNFFTWRTLQRQLAMAGVSASFICN